MTDPSTTPQNTAGTGKPREPDGRFKPGVSGNPGGRPKGLSRVAESARAKTDAMLDVLEKVATDDKAPHSARVSAAVAILDRGWGKPSQPIGGAEDLPPLTQADARALSTEQLEAIIAAAAAEGTQA